MAEAAKRGGLFTTTADIRRATLPRGRYSNKYSNGSVLVLGGSRVYTGAPALSAACSNAALAALRTGTGYTNLLVSRSVERLEKSRSAVLTVRSFSESAGSVALLRAIGAVVHNVLVVGPGIEPRGLVAGSISNIMSWESGKGNRVVLDAGAMQAALRRGTKLTTDVIMTPHSGEFTRLGYSVSDDLDDRMEKAVEFAERYSCTLVLKGHDTVITDGASVKVNRARTPALATMGTGDVLAGMIAAYAASGAPSFESAVAGVTAHSMIGDLLHRRMGNHIIATDLIDAIPSFLKRFDR